MATYGMIKRSGVYQIVNEINGKCYVGSSKNIDCRWKTHRYIFSLPKSPTRSILYTAVKKYGVENFTFIVLEECEGIREILLEREQYYIDTLLPEYNILQRAGSRLGSKSSPETIAKLMGKKHTEEWKLSNSERAKIYMSDPEVREKYSQLRKGKTFAEIFGEELAKQILAKQSANRTGKNLGVSPWNKGVPMSDETKEKLSEILTGREAWNKGLNTGIEPWNKGVPMTDETKEKVSEALKGREPWNKGMDMPDEFCERLSEIAKANFDPEHQQRMVESAREVNTGTPRSEETKQKISESHRTSAARQAVYEARKGYEWTDEQRAQISEGSKTSEKAKAYHQGRIGKSRGNNPSGHYGVIWDKSRNKWQVRVAGKSYGRFENLDEAIRRSNQIVNNEMSLSHVT